MVQTLVVEADLRLVVAHVDVRLPETVGHEDLGSRRGEAVVDEDQPDACLLRRLRTTVHQRQCNTRAWQTSCPGVALRERHDLGSGQSGGSCQRVEVSHRAVAGEVAGQIEGGSQRCRHGQAVDELDVIGVDPLVSDHNSLRWTSVLPQHLNRRSRVDVARTV
ncbi:hypothetical protein H7J88_23810 [Mycolicibacterium flavescens]|nr:hypothetical protein [Mycolicibacterium flavescens]